MSIELTGNQIRAAVDLRDNHLPELSASIADLKMLRKTFPGWTVHESMAKVAALDALYNTRLGSQVVCMSRRVANIMADYPTSQTDCECLVIAKAIAAPCVVSGKKRLNNNNSFASKFVHFFVSCETFPIYDYYTSLMLARHLGNPADPKLDPLTGFLADIYAFRKTKSFSATASDLDAYLWLAGQYLEWLSLWPDASIGNMAKDLFVSPDPRIQELLIRLWPHPLPP